MSISLQEECEKWVGEMLIHENVLSVVEVTEEISCPVPFYFYFIFILFFFLFYFALFFMKFLFSFHSFHFILGSPKLLLNIYIDEF